MIKCQCANHRFEFYKRKSTFHPHAQPNAFRRGVRPQSRSFAYESPNDLTPGTFAGGFQSRRVATAGFVSTDFSTSV